MKFFDQYFTRHHLVHAPHRWFLALLLSPIHAGEQYYKKQYHLNFVHAKKLFFFDIILLLTAAGLAALTVGWLTYSPEVTDEINLSITSDAGRSQSGDVIAYTIYYSNDSEATLEKPILSLTLPENTALETANTNGETSYETSIARSLTTLIPGDKGSITVTGTFYAKPQVPARLTAALSYRQAGRDVRETRYSSLIMTPRGSVIALVLTAADSLIPGTPSPVSVIITHSGTSPIRQLVIPLTDDTGVSIIDPIVHTGSIASGIWTIDNFLPGTTTTLYGSAFLNGLSQSSATLNLTPAIRTTQGDISQQSVRHDFRIVRPEIRGSASWADTATVFQPGKSYPLSLKVENNGNTPLLNAGIQIPISTAIISANELVRLNKGVYDDGLFTIDARHVPELGTLSPSESVTVTIIIPIASAPQGSTNLSFLVSPRVRGTVTEASGQPYTTTFSTEAIPIGTALTLRSSLRYFTPEGDQLGRGPLPPEVGETTKYWAMMNIANTTSEVENVVWRATLAPGIVWTGKKSLTHGQDITFDAATRTVTWQAASLSPFERASVNLELALTPEASTSGTTPTILTNIRLTGTDTYIDAPVFATSADLTIAIPEDAIGRAKGVTVK